jgi:hypothetical protein
MRHSEGVPYGNPHITQLLYWLPDGRPWQQEYIPDSEVEAKLEQIRQAGGRALTPTPQGLEARRAGQ